MVTTRTALLFWTLEKRFLSLWGHHLSNDSPSLLFTVRVDRLHVKHHHHHHHCCCCVIILLLKNMGLILTYFIHMPAPRYVSNESVSGETLMFTWRWLSATQPCVKQRRKFVSKIFFKSSGYLNYSMSHYSSTLKVFTLLFIFRLHSTNTYLIF